MASQPHNQPQRHPSSAEYAEPAFILAIRYEIDQAVSPITIEMRSMREEVRDRLAKGDTAFALQDARINQLVKQCQQHKETALSPRSERVQKPMNQLLAMFLGGALGSAGSVTALWFLIGIGHQAAKGSP